MADTRTGCRGAPARALSGALAAALSVAVALVALVALVAVAAVAAVAVGLPAHGAVAAPTTTPTPSPCPARPGGTGLDLDVPAGVPGPPAVTASAWLLADLTTGDVVAACNTHLPLAPASTLKVLTALALVPPLDPATRYTATPADAGIDGSKVGMVAGSTYALPDLVHGLMLGSGNDAANALAALSGGMPAATARMTAEARRLGARDTVVANTSGLDAKGQVSSAYDLALFGREAMRTPWLATVARTTRYAFPSAGTATGPARATFEIQNHNRLLRTVNGATGLKNGYTVAAGGSYIGTVTLGGRSYVVTVLNAQGSTWRMAASLLKWGFTAGPKATPVARLPEPVSAAAGPTSATTSTTHTTAEASPGAVALSAPADDAGDGSGDGAGGGFRSGSARQDLAKGPVAEEDSGDVPWPVAVGVIVLVAVGGLVLGLRRSRSRSRPR